MADPTLADVLMRPVMPEEYDRPAPLGLLQPHAEAFGAGVIDPGGAPSWLWNKLAASPSSDWYMRRMQEARNQSPIAAGAGSAVLPSLVGFGGVATAMRPWSPSLQNGRFVSEVMEMQPYGWGFGSMGGKFFGGPQRIAPRPQAAYPPGGAY